MKAPSDTLMFQEAGDAPAVIERQFARNASLLAALGERLRRSPPRFIVTIARGSSDHAAAYAKYLFETRLGLVTSSASPAVASVYEAKQSLQGALCIAISQSGKSPDLIKSAEAAKRAGAEVLAFVNVEDSPLAAVADTVIPLHAGPERSVAATKSYLATLAALLQFTAHWSDGPDLHEALATLPGHLRRGWEADWSSLVNGLRHERNLFVVGRGYGLGTALEAALKLKETCGLHAEALSAAEVKHGPMALVGEGFPVLFLAQNDDTLQGTLDVAREFRARGARVWVAAPGVDHDEPGALPLAADSAVDSSADLSPLATPLVAVQSFYRAANALSLARGFNPDVPPHLRKVTETL